ncbi:hypothetical protein ACJMK2_008559 [Sinanodonta woodiana]|uniref:Uncharacterized protein n=1 Tax=Sinanodonta woodiana TaxID=1069815 RepID=A0ABD3VM87_SINWO
MADPAFSQENHSVCPICLSDVTVLRSLPCFHSFCTDCLNSHITSAESNTGGIKSFQCPVCMQETSLQVTGMPSSEWATSFPVNTVLISLQPIREKTAIEKQCDSCAYQEIKSSATHLCTVCKESLCDNCVKYHRSSKLLRNHSILGLEEALSNPEHAVNLAEGFTCGIHDNKDLEFFCLEHDAICCSSCLVEKHTRCTNYVELRTFAKDIKEQQPDQVVFRMKQLEGYLQDVAAIQQRNLTKLEADVKDLTSQITLLRQKINGLLDDLETKVKSEGDKIFKNESSAKQDEIKQYYSLAISIRNSSKLMETITKYGTDVQTFVTLYKMIKHLRDYERKIDGFSITSNKKVKIHIIDKLTDICKERPSDLVKVEVMENEKALYPRYPVRTPSSSKSGSPYPLKLIEPHIERKPPSPPKWDIPSKVRDSPYPLKQIEYVGKSDFPDQMTPVESVNFIHPPYSPKQVESPSERKSPHPMKQIEQSSEDRKEKLETKTPRVVEIRSPEASPIPAVMKRKPSIGPSHLINSNSQDSIESKSHQRFTNLKPLKDYDVIKINEIELIGPNGEIPVYTGVAYLPDDRIVFVDYDNCKCCLFNSSYEHIADYDFTSNPSDVCVVSKNEVAVTLPLKKKIQFLKLDHVISPTVALTTRLLYWGVAAVSEDKLVVSGPLNDTTYHWGVVTRDGKEMSVFQLPRSEKKYDDTHLALDSTRKRVYITCKNHNSVYCFGLDGTKFFEYKNDELGTPVGIGLDRDDNVYVVGLYSASIQQLSGDGKIQKVIKAGIPKFPGHICFKHSGEEFLVTNNSVQKGHKCTIFQLKDPDS